MQNFEITNTTAEISSHEFQVSTQDGIAHVEATYNIMGSPADSLTEGTYLQMVIATRFAATNPKAYALLQEKGYSYVTHQSTAHGDKLDIAYPIDFEPAKHADAVSFIPYTDGSYTSREFVEGLRNSNVLLSVEGDTLDVHDGAFHQPMWELAGTVPGLIPALANKADSLAIAVDATTEEAATVTDQYSEEAHALRLQKIIPQNNLTGFMGNVDFHVSLGGLIASGLNSISNGYPELGKQQIGFALREIFSHCATPFDSRPRTPDENITDEQISNWADRFAVLAGAAA